MSERKLATVRTIDAVLTHHNADKLSIYVIGGWRIVDRKGAYERGDKVLYLEIDSMIPLDNPHFSYLKKFGSKTKDGKLYHRLKTVKLRGEVSQGLIVPLSILEGQEIKEDFDYSELLGIFKYEEPLPADLKGQASIWPQWIEKTDEIRLQTLVSDYKKFVSEIIKDKENWIPYQKIDGTSCTIYSTKEGKIGICSRNFELLEGDNTYWTVVKNSTIRIENRDVPLLDVLSNEAQRREQDIVLQGELFGEGIQKNPIGIKGQKIKLFTIQVNGQRLTPEEIQSDDFFNRLYTQLWVPILDIKMPSTLEEIINQPNGLINKVEGGNQSQIEGIVWRHKSQFIIKIPKEKMIDISKIPEDKREMVLDKIGDLNFDLVKASFKCISSNYLLENE